MLVLLVIFMVTAPMMTPGVLDLPSVAKANLAQQEPPIEINIQADSSISVRDTKSGNKQNLNLSDVASAVQSLISNTERPVIIAADKSVKYEVVMQVMDELQRAAIPRVGLLVKPGR
jgi:biopolymer transport protein TolR